MKGMCVQAWPPLPPQTQPLTGTPQEGQAPSQGGGQVTSAAATPAAAALPPTRQENPENGEGATESHTAPTFWADPEAAKVSSALISASNLGNAVQIVLCACAHNHTVCGDCFHAMRCLASSAWHGSVQLGLTEIRKHAEVQVDRIKGKRAHKRTEAQTGRGMLAHIAKQGLLSKVLDQARLYLTPLLHLLQAYRH